MRARLLLTKLTELGIIPSNSRPLFSYDNAVIEAVFTALKVTPRFLTGGFKSVDMCRERSQKVIQYYNFQHRYNGITCLTAAQHHEGLNVQILENRLKVYAAVRKETEPMVKGTKKVNTHKICPLNARKEPNIQTIAA